MMIANPPKKPMSAAFIIAMVYFAVSSDTMTANVFGIAEGGFF